MKKVFLFVFACIIGLCANAQITFKSVDVKGNYMTEQVTVMLA